MQSALDLVFSTLTLRQPRSESRPRTETEQESAAQFAAQLLETYQARLAQHPIPEQAVRAR